MMSIIELGIISIHAPLRERPVVLYLLSVPSLFQSTLPCGSDAGLEWYVWRTSISIHAPLRERPQSSLTSSVYGTFQSTLPCGSDHPLPSISAQEHDFNPRSLAGATRDHHALPAAIFISIHAPLRERRASRFLTLFLISAFQSTLPCGSDCWHRES